MQKLLSFFFFAISLNANSQLLNLHANLNANLHDQMKAHMNTPAMNTVQPRFDDMHSKLASNMHNQLDQHMNVMQDHMSNMHSMMKNQFDPNVVTEIDQKLFNHLKSGSKVLSDSKTEFGYKIADGLISCFTLALMY